MNFLSGVLMFVTLTTLIYGTTEIWPDSSTPMDLDD